MAIHSRYLERTSTSARTTRAISASGSSLRAGNATSSQSERNDTCILGRMTPSTARAALVGVAPCGQFARNLPDRTTTLTLASVLLLVLSLFGPAARNHRHF